MRKGPANGRSKHHQSMPQLLAGHHVTAHVSRWPLRPIPSSFFLLVAPLPHPHHLLR